MDRKIRGLRRCTQRDCMLPLNRDKNGATNIGTNFMRLFEDKTPIRSMSDEDLDFHRASLCLECECTTAASQYLRRSRRWQLPPRSVFVGCAELEAAYARLRSAT